jgi:toxin HigB-1
MKLTSQIRSLTCRTPTSCPARGVDLPTRDLSACRLHTTRVICRSTVILSLADETTADLFRERNTRPARVVPRDIWPIVRRKLKMLDVAVRLEDLAVLPGHRLDRLKGSQSGRHSIRVNDRYRVTFRWEQGHAYEARVEDYH